jgi:phage-related protein
LFIGGSRDDLREFPAAVRKALGEELLRVQSGLMPVDFKPLKGVGEGVYEIRVPLNGAWRVICVAKFVNAIYVFHAFEKKTQKTNQGDMELAKRRYKLIGE